MKQIHQQILGELLEIAEVLEDRQINAFLKELEQAPRVFVCGEGRSGLMGKAFAMRLMHAGFTVFVNGETITPSIKEKDVLVAISGSGATKSVQLAAEQAKKAGATLLLVTTKPDSEIGRIANCHVKIKAATKQRQDGSPTSLQPMGNSFDQSVHILLDAIVIALTQDRKNINETMRGNHANLE